jgi:hypothetical protein
MWLKKKKKKHSLHEYRIYSSQRTVITASMQLLHEGLQRSLRALLLDSSHNSNSIVFWDFRSLRMEEEEAWIQLKFFSYPTRGHNHDAADLVFFQIVIGSAVNRFLSTCSDGVLILSKQRGGIHRAFVCMFLDFPSHTSACARDLGIWAMLKESLSVRWPEDRRSRAWFV